MKQNKTTSGKKTLTVEAAQLDRETIPEYIFDAKGELELLSRELSRAKYEQNRPKYVEIQNLIDNKKDEIAKLVSILTRAETNMNWYKKAQKLTKKSWEDLPDPLWHGGPDKYDEVGDPEDADKETVKCIMDYIESSDEQREKSNYSCYDDYVKAIESYLVDTHTDISQERLMEIMDKSEDESTPEEYAISEKCYMWIRDEYAPRFF